MKKQKNEDEEWDEAQHKQEQVEKSDHHLKLWQ